MQPQQTNNTSKFRLAENRLIYVEPKEQPKPIFEKPETAPIKMRERMVQDLMLGYLDDDRMQSPISRLRKEEKTKIVDDGIRKIKELLPKLGNDSFALRDDALQTIVVHTIPIVEAEGRSQLLELYQTFSQDANVQVKSSLEYLKNTAQLNGLETTLALFGGKEIRPIVEQYQESGKEKINEEPRNHLRHAIYLVELYRRFQKDEKKDIDLYLQILDRLASEKTRNYVFSALAMEEDAPEQIALEAGLVTSLSRYRSPEVVSYLSKIGMSEAPAADGFPFDSLAQKALKTLARIQNPNGTKMLLQIWENSNDAKLKSIIEDIIIRAKNPWSEELLLPLAGDDTSPLQGMALITLSNIPDTDSRLILEKFHDSSHLPAAVRRSILGGLSHVRATEVKEEDYKEIWEPLPDEEKQKFLWEQVSYASSQSPALRMFLLSVLQSDKEGDSVRETAAKILLTEKPNENEVKPLVDFYQSAPYRYTLHEMIHHDRTPEALIDAILSELSNPKEDSNQESLLRALGDYPSKKTIAALQNFLEQPIDTSNEQTSIDALWNDPEKRNCFVTYAEQIQGGKIFPSLPDPAKQELGYSQNKIIEENIKRIGAEAVIAGIKNEDKKTFVSIMSTAFTAPAFEGVMATIRNLESMTNIRNMDKDRELAFSREDLEDLGYLQCKDAVKKVALDERAGEYNRIEALKFYADLAPAEAEEIILAEVKRESNSVKFRVDALNILDGSISDEAKKYVSGLALTVETPQQLREGAAYLWAQTHDQEAMDYYANILTDVTKSEDERFKAFDIIDYSEHPDRYRFFVNLVLSRTLNSSESLRNSLFDRLIKSGDSRAVEMLSKINVGYNDETKARWEHNPSPQARDYFRWLVIQDGDGTIEEREKYFQIYISHDRKVRNKALVEDPIFD